MQVGKNWIRNIKIEENLFSSNDLSWFKCQSEQHSLEACEHQTKSYLPLCYKFRRSTRRRREMIYMWGRGKGKTQRKYQNSVVWMGWEQIKLVIFCRTDHKSSNSILVLKQKSSLFLALSWLEIRNARKVFWFLFFSSPKEATLPESYSVRMWVKL